MSWSAESGDEELMLCYRDGDAGAFDVLYRLAHNRLMDHYRKRAPAAKMAGADRRVAPAGADGGSR